MGQPDGGNRGSASASGGGGHPADRHARALRLMLGVGAVGVLALVALISTPRGSSASQGQPAGSAARLPSPHAPAVVLEAPSSRMFEGGGLAGHSGIPAPPAYDEQGRASLGVIVGPSLFVWVYGGTEGVRYSVVDLQGQVLASGLTADQVYGAFPEINIPEMEFGPDGALCEPLMWAGEPGGLD